MAAYPQQPQPDKPTREAEPPRRLLLLVIATVAALGATTALTVLGEFVSTQASILTSPENSFAAVAVVLAGWLLLAYPLWPGTLLGGASALDGFWAWLGLRVAEVVIVVASALPLLVATSIFSHQPLERVGELAMGLVGVAAAAIVYRLVHQTCGTGLRAAAVADAMLFVFGPLVVGYLLLEFYALSIGWCWLISPAALAVDVSWNGLSWGGANVLVGLVGYGAVSAAAVPLVLTAGRWHREEERQAAERVRRPLT